VDELANQWARMKVQASELRNQLATSQQRMQHITAANAGILRELRSGFAAPSDTVAAEVPAASVAQSVASSLPAHAGIEGSGQEAVDEPATKTLMVVVDAGEEDEEDEGESDFGIDGEDEDDEPVVYRGEPVYRGALLSEDEDEDEDMSSTVYRGAFYQCASDPSAPTVPFRGASESSSCNSSPHQVCKIACQWPSSPSSCASGGSKRSRSMTSSLAAQPLHPMKHPSSRKTSSPPPEHERVEDLKSLIEIEKNECAKLMAAYHENEEALTRLKEVNAGLMAEVNRLRQEKGITVGRVIMQACAGGGGNEG